MHIAPMSGLLFLPNRQEIKRAGDDGYFIVQRVNRLWLMLSAGLRGFAPLHWLLPRLAPGVRRNPNHVGQLLVDDRYTPVFKRELFHLLGYRILRRGPDLHWPLWRRLSRGLIGVVAAILGMLGGAFRGGERAVLARASENDWIVARRTLDLPKRQRSSAKRG